jgi:putative FmdB family regulatory protein
MPLFTYLCADCGTESEMLIMSASAKPTCPSCGGQKLEKLASAFAPSRTEAAASAAPQCASCASAGGACPYQS